MQDQVPSSHRSSRRWTIAAIAAASVAVVGAALSWHGQAHAFGPGFGPGFGHRHGGWEQMDPAAMEKRLEAMVSFRLADINATPEQKGRITAIIKAAANDLSSLRGQGRELRAKAMALFAAPTVDRAQLENLRVQQMQLHDTVSRRVLQAMADAADVLTPDQRVQLAEKMQQRRRWRG